MATLFYERQRSFGWTINHSGFLQKIKELRASITDRKSSASIEIDRSASLKNVRKILDAGADVILTGKAVFIFEDPKSRLRN